MAAPALPLLCARLLALGRAQGVPAERVLKVLEIMTECVGPLGLAGGQEAQRCRGALLAPRSSHGRSAHGPPQPTVPGAWVAGPGPEGQPDAVDMRWQVLDLKSEGKGFGVVTLDTLQWIHTYKTAALLKAAVASGAVLAGASDAEVEKCIIYAQKIGLAFQVADDILDVTASTEDLGKTAGKDLDADKTTYPKLLGLDRSREVAQELVNEAKEALSEFGDRAAPLNGLADYIIQRKN